MGPAVSEIQPMLAPQASVLPFTSEDWVYSTKFDGYRTLAGISKGTVELRSRNGAISSLWFPEVVEALSKIRGEHVIDGEAVVLDERTGVSDFDRLHARAMRRRWMPGAPVTLMAFDIMVHRGRDVRALPHMERQHRLQELIAMLPKVSVLYSHELPAEKELFERFVIGLKLEGFMAKLKRSAYTGGRSRNWLKIKRAGAVPAGRFRRGA
jgi:bifunctional non-homologous end joining protein LigD